MTPSGKRLRSPIPWIHTWIGIILGVIVSVVCVTGSVIVFRQNVGVHFRADGPAPNASLNSAVLQIAARANDARVTRVRFPSSSNEPYVFQVRANDGVTHRIAFDASTERILGEIPKVAWMDWMIDLHRNLLAGRSGRNAVGAIGIALLALGSTSLIMWIAAGWRALVTVRRGRLRRFAFELHRAVGLWAVAFLLALSATGIGLAYPKQLRSAWENITGLPATAPSPKISRKGPAVGDRSLDEYIAAATAAMPDGSPVELRLPESPRNPVELRFRRAGDLAPTGVNRVYLDPATAKVLSVDLAANWPLGVRIFQSLQPIHYGEFGGLPVKILWSVFGVAPSVLFLTGLVVWRRPKNAKARRTVLSESEISTPAVVSR